MLAFDIDTGEGFCKDKLPGGIKDSCATTESTAFLDVRCRCPFRLLKPRKQGNHPAPSKICGVLQNGF